MIARWWVCAYIAPGTHSNTTTPPPPKFERTPSGGMASPTPPDHPAVNVIPPSRSGTMGSNTTTSSTIRESQAAPTIAAEPAPPSMQQQQNEEQVPEKVASLKAMFPDFDVIVLQSVLDAAHGNQDRAIDTLLSMSDPSYVSATPEQQTPSGVSRLSTYERNFFN